MDNEDPDRKRLSLFCTMDNHLFIKLDSASLNYQGMHDLSQGSIDPLVQLPFYAIIHMLI